MVRVLCCVIMKVTGATRTHVASLILTHGRVSKADSEPSNGRRCSLILINNKARFSKSVLDIKTRLVVTVELGTKWMQNSDFASNFMPEYKFLGYYDLPNSFMAI